MYAFPGKSCWNLFSVKEREKWRTGAWYRSKTEFIPAYNANQILIFAQGDYCELMTISKSILPCRQFGTSNARIDCSRERTHCRLIPPSVKLQPRSELRISSGMHVPSSWYARSICHSHVINDGSRSDSSVIPMNPFRYPIWTSWMDLRRPVNGRQRYEMRKFSGDIFLMSKVVAKPVLLIYREGSVKAEG